MKRVMVQKNFSIKHKIGWLFVLLFLLITGLSLVKILPTNAVTKPGKSEGGTGSKKSDCSTEICYSAFKPYAGVSWILYEFDKMGLKPEERANIPYSRFLNNKNPSYPINNTPTKLEPGDTSVHGCENSKGVYIFSYNLYSRNSKKLTGGAALPLFFKTYIQNTGKTHYNGNQGRFNRVVDINEVKNNYTYFTATGREDPVEVEKWNRGEFSWFCTRDTIEKKKDPEPPAVSTDTTCSQIPGTFGAYYKGNTGADTGVINHSYTGTLGHNSWQKNNSGRNFVFAKPGDQVQFYESLCFQAQQVGTATGSSNVWGSQSPPKNRFQIFAQKNGSENSKYIFGDSKVHDGQYHEISRGQSTPYSGSGITTEEYGFTALSPTDKASSNYSCRTNYYRINTPNLTVGYQIPGFTQYQQGCNSADKIGSTTEVGTIISQGIRYNNLRAWYNQYTQWTGENSPSGEPAQFANRYTFDSYDSVYEITNEDRIWGHQSRKVTEIPKYGDPYQHCSNHDSNGKGSNCRTKRDKIGVDYIYNRLYPDQNLHIASDGQDAYLEKKSSVYTPYNFNTSIHSYIESSEGGVGFIGSKINISANYGVTPRENTLISKTPYATHTRPDQTVKVYEMIVDENYPESRLQEEIRTNNTICSGTEQCNLVDEFSRTINTSGNFSGEKNNTELYERTIPDNLPGAGLGKKYCTRSVIWPAASHDSAKNTIENNTSGSAMNGGNNQYHISAASCVTLAKKPNFQVLGGGIYTNGSIITSVSNKAVGGGLGAYPSAATKLFGSWTEFGALAAGKVNGFGTGAIQGYEENYNFNLPNGGADSASNQIALSPLTVSNDNKSGNSGISRIGSAVLARLKARFRDTIIRNSSNTITSLTSNETSAKNYLGLSQLYHQGDTSLSAMNSTANFYQFDRGGNLIARSNTTGEKLMNTLAMYVDGTLTIDRNINIAHETYNAVDDFPQVLIFAKKINITSNVTNVDAWLILDEDYGDNQIDTCSDNHYPNALSCNETLTITGPVFARKLILNRTAGSHTSGGRAAAHPLQTGPTGTYYAEGSIHPAEIFTLRADAYFWAYRQSLSSGQAYMVYSREIAPRY